MWGSKKGWGVTDNQEQQCDKQKEMVLECKRRWSWYAQQATGALRNIGKKFYKLERKNSQNYYFFYCCSLHILFFRTIPNYYYYFIIIIWI